MSDDINLLIYYICSSKQLHRIAVKFKHGMNNELLNEAIEYYSQYENQKYIISMLPSHIQNHIDKIVEITELFDISIID